MATEELEYRITSTEQLNAFKKAIDMVEDMEDATNDMAKGTKKAEKSVSDFNDEIKESIKFSGKMGSALSGVGQVASGLGIGIGSLVGAFGSVMAVTQEWQLGVEQLSAQFSIGLDDASALAASWERAGLDAEQGASIFSSLQGRLLGELESRKEAEKELQNIAKERQSVLAEVAQAEVDYNKNIAELESQRAEINDSAIVERKAKAAEELADLKENYARFIKDQEETEREETKQFEKIWEERSQKFIENSEKLRDKFSTDARKARNVREFSDIKKNYEEQQNLLVTNLEDENKEQLDARRKSEADREESINREKELLAEKSLAISQAADKDVARLQESNEKALANLDERIAQEKEAWDEKNEGFKEQLAGLGNAEAELAAQGGDLTFVMEELGVSVFDANGKMRDMNDIVFDIQESLAGMEDGGRKAALIADLGLEDAAVWLDRGMNQIDSVRYAQERNLIVSEESLDAIHRQREAYNDLKMTALGYLNSLNLTEKANNALVFSMDAILEAGNLAKGLWSQLTTILDLLWKKILEGVDKAKESWTDFTEDIGDTVDTVQNALGFGEGGVFSSVGNLLGFGGDSDTPQYAQGVRSVPGVRPRLAVVHPGEEIRSSARVTQDMTSGRRGNKGTTININAPVFGVDDLNQKIQSAVTRYDRS